MKDLFTIIEDGSQFSETSIATRHRIGTSTAEHGEIIAASHILPMLGPRLGYLTAILLLWLHYFNIIRTGFIWEITNWVFNVDITGQRHNLTRFQQSVLAVSSCMCMFLKKKKKNLQCVFLMILWRKTPKGDSYPMWIIIHLQMCYFSFVDSAWDPSSLFSHTLIPTNLLITTCRICPHNSPTSFC